MTMPLSQLRRIRWAVRAALLVGVAASVAANVLHAEPNPISEVIAAWPPLALLLTIELISRVPVHRRSLAAVRLVATATIAGIAAYVSYWHMVGVAARYGETGPSPYLLPLSVDGLVVVASVSLVELAGRIREAQQTTATTAPEAAVVATVPEGGNSAHGCRIPEPSSRAEAGTMVPAEAAAPGPEIRHAVADLILGQQDGPPVDHDLEVSKLPGAGKPSRLRPARRQTAADRVAKAAARTPTATPAQLAARLKLSERTVQRYLPRPEIANPGSQSGPADDTTTTDEQPSRRDLRDSVEFAVPISAEGGRS